MGQATQRYTSDVLVPAFPGKNLVTDTVRLPGLIDWPKGSVLGIVTGAAASAVHRLTFGGTVSGGTFRLVYGSEVTNPITYSATPATLIANITAALEATSMNVGNVVVSGTGPYDITFQNDLANRSIPAPTAINALTGTSPTITPSLQTAGYPGTGLAGLYDDALSDGTQIARSVLAQATKTNLRGEVVTDRPGAYPAGTVFVSGFFKCSDLTGLDAAGVVDLGRLINAPTIATTGAILSIR